MKKTLLFLLVLVLLGTMGITGLAWAQVQLPTPYKKITKPPPPPPPSKIVFVTSEVYNGNLGGVSGADWRCQQLAQRANLPGTYKAWISGPGPQTGPPIGPGETFTRSAGPYRRVDGSVVANNWTSLITQPLLNPIFLDEYGRLIPTSTHCNIGTPVWTGNAIMADYRILPSVDNCWGWTVGVRQREECDPCRVPTRPISSECVAATTGEAIALKSTDPFHPGGWTQGPISRDIQHCYEAARLYCFQQ